MTITTDSYLADLTTEMHRAAEELGRDHGTAAGSWAIDGNTDEATARAILDMGEEGDPALDEYLPVSPLSGQWADEPTAADILETILDGEYVSDSEQAELLDTYERAYFDAAHETIMTAARYLVEG